MTSFTNVKPKQLELLEEGIEVKAKRVPAKRVNIDSIKLVKKIESTL